MEIFKTFKKPKDLLILFGLIALAGVVFWGIWNHLYHQFPQQVLIITEKPKYLPHAELKLAIKNILPNTICFSSCYPYYLETQGKQWITYEYYDICLHPDLIEICLDPGYGKFFGIDLPDLAPGTHRIKVPVTISGKVGEKFREDQIFYSNDFLIRYVIQ